MRAGLKQWTIDEHWRNLWLGIEDCNKLQVQQKIFICTEFACQRSQDSYHYKDLRFLAWIFSIWIGVWTIVLLVGLKIKFWDLFWSYNRVYKSSIFDGASIYVDIECFYSRWRRKVKILYKKWMCVIQVPCSWVLWHDNIETILLLVWLCRRSRLSNHDFFLRLGFDSTLFVWFE